LRKRGIAAAYLNSTLAQADRRTILGLALSGQVRLLYCAPERLASLSRLVRDAGVRVPLLAVDEAHCIVEWGNAFRPMYRQLGEFRYHLQEPQTLALTGSATATTRREILEVLRIPQAEVVAASFDRPNLRFEVERVKDDRDRYARLVRALDEAGGQAIVYAPTRRLTELVTRALRLRGHKAAPYHAGLDADIRKPVLGAFLHDRAPVMVATSAFGMGIDKPDVRLVLHWGPPRTLESYYQEAGGGGRARSGIHLPYPVAAGRPFLGGHDPGDAALCGAAALSPADVVGALRGTAGDVLRVRRVWVGDACCSSLLRVFVGKAEMALARPRAAGPGLAHPRRACLRWEFSAQGVWSVRSHHVAYLAPPTSDSA
jgi:hypothetical protein